VHYGGYAVDMQVLLDISIRRGILLVEDAAQAIGSRYNGILCGTIGHFGAFSFHETKNIHCGEGGMLVVNDERFAGRAEIIWEKGTDRSAFFRKEVDKYTWQDLGSSFLPSELQAAWLWAQIEHYDHLRLTRAALWDLYRGLLSPLEETGKAYLLHERPFGAHNHHLMALVCSGEPERVKLVEHLEKQGIMAVSHYRCLHSSPYFSPLHDGREMPHAARFEGSLLRLPLFHELKASEVEKISEVVKAFYD
jgi:dTDP-4-amino-4,6-dideoxygalactose transaminase